MSKLDERYAELDAFIDASKFEGDGIFVAALLLDGKANRYKMRVNHPNHDAVVAVLERVLASLKDGSAASQLRDGSMAETEIPE